MGNRHSKKSGKVKKGTAPSKSFRSRLVFEMDAESEEHAISQRTYDEMEVRKLKKELLETPQIFVLNNLLMSVMFFENYDREKQRLTHSSVTPLEKELNPALMKNENIECVIPDVIFESVNKNVRFRHIHGPNKNKTEPLAPRRFYVVNDNIEVLESHHTAQYSAIDKPSYQVVVEDSEYSGAYDNTAHPGYVKLKCAPHQLRNIEKLEAPVEQEPQPGPSSRPDPNEIYEYSTIANINTPKPINITSYERRDTLPKSCFTKKPVKKYDDQNDNSDDDYEEEEDTPTKKDLYENVTYISSDGFMKYFQNAIFPGSLGVALGFDSTEIALAKAIPGKIFCNLQDVDEDFPLFPCEIVPSVAIQWPIQICYEFHQRSERPTVFDKFHQGYRWPQDSMIKDISGLSCVLIPRGYTPKREKNVNSDIEWEVGFPKAQRYLDTRMSHTQVRAFLFLLTIYKTYIEPVNKRYDGVLIDHLRTHIYWECESNPKEWPEHRLGTKMVLIIRSFIKKLSSGELQDFFIAKKNVFSNVPNKHLTHAQKVFHDILESPAIYFIGALRHLKYTSARFYPTINFRRLYTILTAANALQLINPRIQADLPPNYKQKNRRPVPKGDAMYRKEIKHQMKKERINREIVLRKIQEQKEKEDNLKIERRGSVDSIDFKWQCEKAFDTAKKREIIIFFVTHFIEMARRSRRLANQRQALFFLKQGWYLCRILQEIGLEGDSREYIEVINREEETSKKISISESVELPPSTPKRNSVQFNWDLNQQVKGNVINLNNLNKAYNNQAPNNFSKLKKQPSNLKSKSSFLRNTEDGRTSVDTGVRRSVGFVNTVEMR